MRDKRTGSPHRPEENGSYDSMSLIHLPTAARAQAETSRAEIDTTPTCDTAFLAERGCFSQVGSTSQATRTVQRRDRADQGQRTN